jgi:hypothetical protein
MTNTADDFIGPIWQDETEAELREMEHRPQSSNSNISVIGLQITVLIFLLVQTAAIAFWAGQLSSKQDTTREQVQELKQKFEIIQVQYQVMGQDIAVIKAAAMKGANDSNNSGSRKR